MNEKSYKLGGSLEVCTFRLETSQVVIISVYQLTITESNAKNIYGTLGHDTSFKMKSPGVWTRVRGSCGAESLTDLRRIWEDTHGLSPHMRYIYSDGRKAEIPYYLVTCQTHGRVHKDTDLCDMCGAYARAKRHFKKLAG